MADSDDVFGARPLRQEATHEIGQRLDSLSVEDLIEHLEILRAEVLRLEADLVQKRVSRHAAEQIFGSPQEKSR